MLSSYREFVFPGLSCVSLEHGPVQLKGRQNMDQTAFCRTNDVLLVEVQSGGLKD